MKYLFLLFLFFTACCHSTAETKPHIIAADRVTDPFIQSALCKHKLLMIGSGGMMMHQVEQISLSFAYYAVFDLNQARCHFIKIAEEFVNTIRDSNELRQYLVYPNEPERVANIGIVYRDKQHKQPDPPKIAYVFMLNGKVSYGVNDDFNGCFREVYEETYQEAIDKAKGYR